MIERKHISQRMSQLVIHNGLVFTAGQVAADTSQDASGQTRQVLAQIDTLLAEAGTDKTRLLKANIWLSDIRYFDQMNSIWDHWVYAEHPPVRACVEARLAGPEFLVEIQVVAAQS